MRIALYGGSFNPPHVAHQMACLYVLSTKPIDQVWMIPCFQHPFGKSSIAFQHRMNMCKQAASIFGSRVLVSDIESELGGVSYTLRTVQTLQRLYPEYQFSLLVGEDVLASQTKWYGFEELQQRVPFMVLGREGVTSEQSFAIRLPEISSTWIRECLAKHSLPSGLLPTQVLEYIKHHQLYQP